METERTISQWFATLVERQRLQVDASINTSLSGQDDVHWDDNSLDQLHDVLRVMLATDVTPDGHRLSDSLPAPSPTTLTQSAQVETNQMLADILTRVTENDGTFGPVMPYGQVAEMGGGLDIYNAAFLPGWPPRPFAKNPDASPQQAAQYQRNEAEIVAYLTEQGLNKDLLSKVLSAFKTAAERVGFLVWLGTLIAIATGTLATLRKEAADQVTTTDGDLDLPKNRQFLQI